MMDGGISRTHIPTQSLTITAGIDVQEFTICKVLKACVAHLSKRWY